jgi:hypothetical protein
MDYRYYALYQDDILERFRVSPQFSNFTEEQVLDAITELCEDNIIKPVYNVSEEESLTLHDSVTDLRGVMRDMTPIKRFIVNQLIEVLGVFWSIILGAQKTKTDQMMKIIKLFLESNIEGIRSRTIIPILFTRNDQELTNHTVMRMLDRFARSWNIKVYLCSSSKIQGLSEDLSDRIVCNPRADTISDAIELLHYNPSKPTPIIISLTNKTQVTKVTQGVYDKINDFNNIKHSTFLDEADEIYPLLRTTIRPYLCDITDDTCVPKDKNFATYFITATHESLFDFPEVKICKQKPINLADCVKENYRDINHTECRRMLPNLRQQTKESNGDFVFRVLTDYKKVFHEAIVCRDGIARMPIVLATADYKNADQVELGERIRSHGFNSIVLNQNGFRCIFANGRPSISLNKRNTEQLRGKQMNERLYYITTTKFPELRQAPLVLIGHRKLDRAITYHYAPPDSTLPGMLMTDEIFGEQKNLAKAVQTSGRINGVIAHRPDYCGFIRIWYDQRTYESVLHQVRVVSNIEENSYVPSNLVELHDEAVSNVPGITQISNRDIREIGPFNTKAECFAKLTELMDTPKYTEAFKTVPDATGYELGTRLIPHHGIYVDDLRVEHRVVLDKTGEGIAFNTIKQGVSVDPSKGERTKPGQRRGEGNFNVIPVYANSQTPPTETQYMARYEEPTRDSKGNALYINDKVVYDNITATVKSIEYSKNGIPAKLVLSDNRTVRADETVRC